MKRNLILFSVVFLFSCSQSTDKSETQQTETTVDSASVKTYEQNMSAGSKSAKEEKVMALITMAKQTMDSIDAAYTTIRSSSRLMSLSLEEREDVNEALQQMNVAKELIILETQKEIIDQLQQKTNTLNSVIDHIYKTSDRLNNIAITISKVTNIIQKATNMLASGFTMGIIKPKTEVAAN